MKKVLLAGLLLPLSLNSALAQVKIIATPATATSPVTTSALSGNNIVIGNTGYTGTTSAANIVVGSSSASSGFTGSESVIMGVGAGASATNSGWANIFIGQNAGNQNTSGSGNTFLGRWAGTTNQTGISNTMLGLFSGTYNTSGDSNAFVGLRSGFSNTIGRGNTLMGSCAGIANTQGHQNTAIGARADFGSGNLINATAIGSNSLVSLSNSMALGGRYNSTYDVKVGIGTDAPTAHLHLLNKGQEDVVFSTIEPTYTASSRLQLQTLNTLGGVNSALTVVMNGRNTGGTILPAVPGAAPVLLNSNAGMVVSEGNAPLVIGVNGQNNATANTHFITSVYTAPNFKPWECMRINDSNGFVGIHTRTAVTGGGLGDPQALFHVNLTRPANAGLNTAVNGIRFEGLPTIAHPDVVVIDPNGNLARRSASSIAGASSWLLSGNSTGGSEFIGTLTNDDFRIYTNNQLRARVTSTGTGASTMSDFDFGANTFIAANNSAGFGLANTVKNVTSSMVIGANNNLYFADHSSVTGQRNTLQNTSVSSMIVGEDNVMTNCISTIQAGSGNNMVQSSESIVGGAGHSIARSPRTITGGSGHVLKDAHQCLTAGDNNSIDVSSGGSALGSSNSILSSNNTLVAGTSNLSFGADGSGVLGSRNTVSASRAAFALGSGNLIQNGASGITSDSSVAAGGSNQILGSTGAFAGGTRNIIQDADGTGCIALGTGNSITKSNESFAAGEDNKIVGAHGTFVGGGHNFSEGRYNVVMGHRLIASAVAAPIAAAPTPDELIMVIGDQINNTLKSSLVAGFNGNRTMTVTERGVSIQVRPSTALYPVTYTPQYNLEVDADPAGSPTPVGSNIAFYNLPQRSGLPAVLVDGNGELYQSNALYAIWNPGSGTPVVTDAKFARNAVAITDAVQLISKMQPRKYTLDATGQPSLAPAAGSETYGLVAQDLETVLPALVKDIRLDDKTVKGVDYTEVIPILVQAIKDQQKQIDQLKSLVASAAVASQNESIARLDVKLSDRNTIMLLQNVPNPCDNAASIGFYIPAAVKEAVIQFATIDGKIFQTVHVAERGKGVVNISTSELIPGVYVYTLIADGKAIETKRMEVLK